MNYQKFYTNGIHSSSLLCQLATMWKSQTLCDAVIKTGNINTKAHRLVLVAACPMLQSMDNASIGSHLEVRLASEIKQDSVNMFLQYLYEGFMMLTEENHKDIEKIARLLQVDSIIKCCADFCKSLHEKTGLSIYNAGQYKYSSHDMLEFKHVRVSGIQKTVQDSMNKRHSDFQRPNSPGSKRPRMHRPGSPSNDGQRGDNMYGHSSHSDSSDRVPRLGLGSYPGAAGRNLQPGVIEVIEDSLELVQTEPVERDPITGRPTDSRPPVQKTVAISVASQVTGGDPDLQIINVSGMRDGASSSHTHMSPATHTTSTPIARDSRGMMGHSSYAQQSSSSMNRDIPSSSRVSSERAMPSLTRPDLHHQRQMQQNQFASVMQQQQQQQQQQQKQSSSQYPSIPQALIDMDFTAKSKPSDIVFPTILQKAAEVFPTSLPKPSEVAFPEMQSKSTPISKPFAAGSAGQATHSVVPVHINTSSSSSSPIASLPPVSPVVQESSPFSLSASSPSSRTSQPQRSESTERSASAERPKEERPSPSSDPGPDISIVKIESTDKDETGALDMYVDTGDDGEVHPIEGDGDQTYEGSDYDVEEPPGEMEGSNEGSNLSGDQNAWYLNTMKGPELGPTLGSYVASLSDVQGMHLPHGPVAPQPAQQQSGHASSDTNFGNDGAYLSSNIASFEREILHSTPSDRSQPGFQSIYGCPICIGVHFRSKSALGHHLKGEHDKYYVTICVECGKGFKSQSGANHHDRLHHQDKSELYQCKTCGKYFTCISLLRIHERCHSDTRNFLCTECGKGYKHKKNLQSHVCAAVPDTDTANDSQYDQI